MKKRKPFVVVVDDDESVTRSITRLLRAAGMIVEAYTNAADFLARLHADAAYRPDCVVTDIFMPEIDGFELQRRLAGRNLPILFITASDAPQLGEEARAAGALACLRKPFQEAHLLEQIQAAVGSSGPAPQP